MENNRKVGTRYEQQVADWLVAHDYRLLERNFRCRLGEIDLIAKKDGCIVFVEVKYRRRSRYGDPAEAVDVRKRLRISNVASYYLYIHHYPLEMPVRFDVASVSRAGVTLYENAFTYCGRFGG